jgi:hypothetical protein
MRGETQPFVCGLASQSNATAAYAACGFKKEGILKRLLFVDGALGRSGFDGGVPAGPQASAQHQRQAAWRDSSAAERCRGRLI